MPMSAYVAHRARLELKPSTPPLNKAAPAAETATAGAVAKESAGALNPPPPVICNMNSNANTIKPRWRNAIPIIFAKVTSLAALFPDNRNVRFLVPSGSHLDTILIKS